MKKYLVIFALLFGAASSWGHEPGLTRASINSTIELKESAAPNLLKWTLLESKDNVKVYRAYTMCSDQLRVAIKVENANAFKVRVNWNSAFVVSGNKVAITLPFTVDVEANATLSGDCQQASLLFDPYLFVTTIQEGICDYTIQNLNIVVL